MPDKINELKTVEIEGDLDFESLKLIKKECEVQLEYIRTVNSSLTEKIFKLLTLTITLLGFLISIYLAIHHLEIVPYSLDDSDIWISVGNTGIISSIALLFCTLLIGLYSLRKFGVNISAGASIKDLFNSYSQGPKKEVISTLIIGSMIDIKISKLKNTKVAGDISLMVLFIVLGLMFFIFAINSLTIMANGSIGDILDDFIYPILELGGLFLLTVILGINTFRKIEDKTKDALNDLTKLNEKYPFFGDTEIKKLGDEYGIK